MDNQPSYKDQLHASLNNPKLPFYKKRGTWIIAAIVVVAVIIAGIAFAMTRSGVGEDVIVEQLPDGTRIEREAITEPSPAEEEVPVVAEEPAPELPTILDETE